MATTPDSFWFDDIRLQALETEEKVDYFLPAEGIAAFSMALYPGKGSK